MGKATREAYGEALAQLVQENKKIVVLDADLAGSTKTNLAKKVAPERFFDMGIAEADMIGHAAGLAASGYTAFASSFAMFCTGRAWEQIRNSVAYPKLNVKICGTHAGISVGEDGVSHQAIEDIALMRVIPEMEVYVPCDATETKAIIRHVAHTNKPSYVRLGRSSVEDVYDEKEVFDFAKPKMVKEGKDAVIFACGSMVQSALEAANKLQEEGKSIAVVDVFAIKPCSEKEIAKILSQFDRVFTAEEHNVIGGLGGLIAEISTKLYPRIIHRIGMQDCFAESGSAKALMQKYKLDGDGVCEEVKKVLSSH
ncbi:transketolase family protein [Bulleidia sp. zg-1006]|uniref:transketolase family protein n=1 Tax=Bulleidia sp. zg-1006 TaxID=2806552 RepID=UPI00193A7280|nr:transketolase C-terminal domain-containing protein [Bulleidia sp. zg-1006]QRG86579.1 transketolase family protein [Bulleidia sp. zg-1006]